MSPSPPRTWYDADREVEHQSQGDIYLGIPQRILRYVPAEDEPVGARRRESLEGSFAELDQPVSLPVILCSHDCTFVAQPEGTRDYSHPFRVVAPIVPFEILHRLPDGTEQISRAKLQGVADNTYVSGLLCIDRAPEFGFPDPPDDWANHCAVAVYRSYLTTQTALDAASPPALRLSVDGLRWLHRAMIHTFSGNQFDPWDLLEPDVSDSWNPQV